MPPYKEYIPQTIGEIMDMLADMMLSSPTFKDKTGYFPHRSLESEFYTLNESLKLIRKRVGEENYKILVDLSDRMRAHFEADPENKTEDTIRGRELIEEMEDVLKAAARRRRR